jgi:hypothetical protein
MKMPPSQFSRLPSSFSIVLATFAKVNKGMGGLIRKLKIRENPKLEDSYETPNLICSDVEINAERWRSLLFGEAVDYLQTSNQ